MPTEARASAAYFACSVLQRGLSLVTLPLFSRMLTKVEYGQSTIYSSWESLLIIFVTLNLGYGSFGTAMMKYEDRRGRYYASVSGVVMLLASVFVVVYLPFRRLLNQLFELPTWIMLLMAAQMVASSALQCWYSWQRFELRYRRVVTLTLTTSILSVAIAISMVFLTDGGQRGYAKILGTAFPSIVVGFTLILINGIHERTLFDREMWRWALSFNLPLVPYYLSQMLFNQSDRIMISHLSGTADAATYAVAYSLATLMTFVLNAINGAYVPWFYGRIKAGKLRENRPVAVGIAALMASLLLLVIAAAPEIIWLMASEKYADACWVVGPVAMGMLFHFYSQLFVNVQFYYEEKWLLVAGTAVAGISNVTLNWLLIPSFGYVAAAYTTLLSFFLMAAGNWVMYRMVLKRHGMVDEMFDYRALIMVTVVLIGLGFASMSLYEYPVARFALIVSVVVMGVANSKRIVGLVSGLRGRGVIDGD